MRRRAAAGDRTDDEHGHSGRTSWQHARLVSALALVLGWEAMILLRDVRGLDATQEDTALRWAARVLVEAMVDEAR